MAITTEETFERLIEAHRRGLHAHCYRMLGSLHDAEDAYQEAMLRAWRALPRLREDAAARTWLYRIATNVCLNAIARRPRRVLPADYGPAWSVADGVGEPTEESLWLEPYPDSDLESRLRGRPMRAMSSARRSSSRSWPRSSISPPSSARS